MYEFIYIKNQGLLLNQGCLGQSLQASDDWNKIFAMSKTEKGLVVFIFVIYTNIDISL